SPSAQNALSPIWKQCRDRKPASPECHAAPPFKHAANVPQTFAKEAYVAKVLVLYYSTYGHIETMAEAIAEGARGVAGTKVTLKRVPELMPRDVAERAGAKLGQAAPLATVDELPDYDAIIFGTPT